LTGGEQGAQVNKPMMRAATVLGVERGARPLPRWNAPSLLRWNAPSLPVRSLQAQACRTRAGHRCGWRRPDGHSTLRRGVSSSTPASSRFSSWWPSARPEWPGHAAFILTGLSFASPSELSLRLLATASCSFACIFNYYHPIGKTLWLPLRWNALYLALNAFYACRLLSERCVKLSAEEEQVYRQIFSRSMSAADFRRLFALGREAAVRDIEDREVITKGMPNDVLVLLLDGTGVIHLGDGVTIARTGGLFGEVSFLHGEPASATVRLQPASRYISWTRDEVYARLGLGAQRGLEHALSLEVTKHLAQTSSRMVALSHPVESAAAWRDVQVSRLQRGGSVGGRAHSEERP